MAHVLIGFGEALPAPEVVFSLLSAGHRVSVFARGRDLPLARLPLTGLHVIPAPETDTQGAKDALLALMTGSNPPDVILPLDDAGLWLIHETLGPDPRIAGGPGPAAAIALDKTAQITAARNAGLPVPETLIWDGTRDTLPKIPRFPAIAKPGLALGERAGKLCKGDAHYLAGAEDAEAFFADADPQDAPWIIQPLIQGRGIGVFGFVRDTGEVTAWSGHYRVRMMNPHGSGASACARQMPEESLRREVAEFLIQIGWRGPFMMEFLRDSDETPWFMELNGRMWGSMALARRQGFEYPAWSIAQVQDPAFIPVEPAPVEGPLIVRHLGRELLHLAFTARGPKSDFHKQDWPRLRASLGAVLRPGSGRLFYNHDPAYPRFYLRDAIWTVKKMLRR